MATPPAVNGNTVLDEIVARTRLSWTQFIIVAAVCLVAALGLATYLDQDFRLFADTDLLRVFLTTPSVILYILIAYYYFGVRSSNTALAALQQLLGLDDAAFARLQTPVAVAHRRQWIALSAGLIVQLLLSSPWNLFTRFTWLGLYLWLPQITMMALLGFIIYISAAENTLINKLEKYPMQVNLFDTTLFETLGRSSLTSALMLIGGSTLVVVVLPARYLMNIFSIGINVGIVLLAVAAFFLTLRSTHRVMLTAKQHELAITRAKLKSLFDDSKARGAIENPEAVRVWLMYEKRIQEAPEWPFNTETLRSLVVSVFVPAAAFVARWWLGQL